MDSPPKKKRGRPKKEDPSDKGLQRRKQRQAQKDGTNKPRGRPKSTQKQTQSQVVNVKINQPKTKSKSKSRGKSRPREQMPPASIPMPTTIIQPAPASNQPDITPLIQAIIQRTTPLEQKVNETTTNAQKMAGVKAEERRAGKTADSFRSMSNEFFGSDQDLVGFEPEPTPSVVSSVPTGFFNTPESSILDVSPDSSVISPDSSESSIRSKLRRVIEEELATPTNFVSTTKGTGTFSAPMTQAQMFEQQELRPPVELFRELGMISPRPTRREPMPRSPTL